MTDLPNFDAWKLSSLPEPKTIGYCQCGCGEEVYEREEIINTVEGRIKTDHFDDFAKMILKAKKGIA